MEKNFGEKLIDQEINYALRARLLSTVLMATLSGGIATISTILNVDKATAIMGATAVGIGALGIVDGVTQRFLLKDRNRELVKESGIMLTQLSDSSIDDRKYVLQRRIRYINPLMSVVNFALDKLFADKKFDNLDLD